VLLITKTLADHGHTENIPVWLGVQVDMQSEEALLLLGCPIGTTIAFLLVQHKEEPGLKHVSSITVFRDFETGPGFKPEIQLLFRIDDVAEDERFPEDTEILDEDTTRVATWRRRVERRDSMLDLDLERSVSRVHEMRVDERVRWCCIVVSLSGSRDCHDRFSAFCSVLPFSRCSFVSPLGAVTKAKSNSSHY
jgi:hypothetical protein